jgi:hypothetical protein
MVYEQLGKYKKAEASLRRSMTWAGKSLGEESPQYLEAVRGFIAVFEKQGKFVEAEEMLGAGLAMVERMSGPFKEEETKEMQAFAGNFSGLKK